MISKTYTGIVLKHQPLREADEVITFWSWEEGKVRLLARSVRRGNSKLKGALSPITWLELQIVPSLYLPVISGARVVKSYPLSVSRLDLLAVIFNIFEMIIRSTGDRQSNHDISLLLRAALDYLEERKTGDIEFLINFRLRLLGALGYSLQLDVCSYCQKAVDFKQQIYFSFLAGGVGGAECLKYFPDARILSADIAGYLKKVVLQEEFTVVEGISKENKFKTETLLQDYFRFLTERNLNSEEFLRENIIA